MGRKALDLSGLKYERWLVLYRTNTCKPAMWMCRCECGTERAVWDADLKRGKSTSCGCFKTEENIRRLTTHGFTGKIEYRSWKQMIQRCENQNHESYEAYGGRGIEVCKKWRDDFMAFYLDVGPAPQGKYSIDRIKNHLGYEPENCQWATPQEQSNNRRDVPFYDYHDKKLTIRQAINASKNTICMATVKFRMRKGWDIVKAVDTPVNKNYSRSQVC